MGKVNRSKAPRTFFLNETHELGRGKKSGGGRAPKFASVDWSSKGATLNKSLDQTVATIEKSSDPLKQKRFFFVAIPEEKIEKLTEAKDHPTGLVEETTDFGKDHSQTFSRLGIDLIEVTPEGDAIVHATPEKVGNLLTRTESLGDLGVREQARWARVKKFETIPVQLRIDNFWISKSKPDEVLDVVVELQPVLVRQEVDLMFRAIAELISNSRVESLITNGKDFSGRNWLRGNLTRKTIQKIARDFYSVQSLHGPLFSMAAAITGRSRGARPSVQVANRAGVDHLPTVAVFDDGIPKEHHYLGQFRRGQYQAPATGVLRAGPHGSKVASRIVFGEQDFHDGLDGVEELQGECQFIDVNVSGANGTIHEKSVPEAMSAIAGVYRDARVFNFSFSAAMPLDPTEHVKRREELSMTQDVDNFVFENDVIVAVCAGNSPTGIAPTEEYPNHIDDPNWKIGHWASGYNTIVSGAFVDHLSSEAIVKGIGWPSPFTRIGPGLSGSPVPNFCASGGNRGVDHRYHAGLGVSVCNEFGQWEDSSGTSFAVPITAREAAFTLNALQNYCAGEVQPFGVTAKAFLGLTATPPHSPDMPSDVEELSQRTLGRGIASANRIESPVATSAVFIWQGVLENPSDKIQVQFPIPLDWFNSAEIPMLRLVCSADVPVNVAVPGVWACRRVNCALRSAPESKAFRSKMNIPHNEHLYPIFERVYQLNKTPKGVTVDDDIWILELTYEEVADYPAGQEFSPQQRVAFAGELFDGSEVQLSPQEFVQDLPIAASMSYLSVSTEIKLPIIVRR